MTLNINTDNAAYSEAVDTGKPFQVDAETFDYFLGVLPPVYMSREVELPDWRTVRAAFGFADGAERIVAFWRHGAEYWACRTNEWNRG